MIAGEDSLKVVLPKAVLMAFNLSLSPINASSVSCELFWRIAIAVLSNVIERKKLSNLFLRRSFCVLDGILVFSSIHKLDLIVSSISCAHWKELFFIISIKSGTMVSISKEVFSSGCLICIVSEILFFANNLLKVSVSWMVLILFALILIISLLIIFSDLFSFS
jgi:hypothetical protein